MNESKEPSTLHCYCNLALLLSCCTRNSARNDLAAICDKTLKNFRILVINDQVGVERALLTRGEPAFAPWSVHVVFQGNLRKINLKVNIGHTMAQQRAGKLSQYSLSDKRFLR